MFNWPAFLTYMIITAITPGPNNITSMTNGSMVGFRRSLPFNFAVLAGFSFIMTIVALFSNTLFRIIPTIRFPMQILGAAYILWLAYKTVTSDAQLATGHVTTTFRAGVFLQFINVKLYIYGITSLGSYILPHYDQMPIILGFCIILAITAFVSTLLWSAFGASFRTLFSHHSTVVNYIMGGLLAYCAIALFF